MLLFQAGLDTLQTVAQQARRQALGLQGGVGKAVGFALVCSAVAGIGQRHRQRQRQAAGIARYQRQCGQYAHAFYRTVQGVAVFYMADFVCEDGKNLLRWPHDAQQLIGHDNRAARQGKGIGADIGCMP